MIQPEIVHTIGPKKQAQERDVTMVAQFSISRLDRFEKAILAWSGPVSAVMYVFLALDCVSFTVCTDRCIVLLMHISLG